MTTVNPRELHRSSLYSNTVHSCSGDCWLLAAIASLTLNKQVLARVVPHDQSFEENYAGIFHFEVQYFDTHQSKSGTNRVLIVSSLWLSVLAVWWVGGCGGWWPLAYQRRRAAVCSLIGGFRVLERAAGEGLRQVWRNGSVCLCRYLLFCSIHSLTQLPFRVNGCYEALSGGSTIEGFEDFTGGIAERHDLANTDPHLFKIIKKALDRGSLLGCSIDVCLSSLFYSHVAMLVSSWYILPHKLLLSIPDYQLGRLRSCHVSQAGEGPCLLGDGSRPGGLLSVSCIQRTSRLKKLQRLPCML